MRPEESESVYDNLEVTQLLSHDCRPIFLKFREKKMTSEIDFLQI